MPDTERRMTDAELLNIPLRDIQLDALERIVDSIIDHAVDNEVAETIGIGTKRVITDLRLERAENARLRELNQLREQHSGALEELLKACWSQGKTPTETLDTYKRTAYKIKQLTEQEATDE